jgi:hypothetical protein
MVNGLVHTNLKTVSRVGLQFFFLFCVCCSLILLQNSCISVSLNTNFKRGNGNIVSSVLPITPFTSIVSSIPCRYKIVKADTSHCRIEIDDNLIGYLDVSVKDSVLYLQSSYAFFTSTEPVIYITSPSIDSIVNLALSTITINNVCDRMVVHQKAGSIITLNGSANESLFEIDNSGEIHAANFPTSITYAYANGYGVIKTSTDSLFAKCTGKGKVEYTQRSAKEVFVKKILLDKGSVKEIR